MREAWLIAVEACSIGGLYALKRDRNASIKYETSGTGEELTGEDFQNRETFIVISRVVVKSESVYLN